MKKILIILKIFLFLISFNTIVLAEEVIFNFPSSLNELNQWTYVKDNVTYCFTTENLGYTGSGTTDLHDLVAQLDGGIVLSNAVRRQSYNRYKYAMTNVSCPNSSPTCSENEVDISGTCEVIGEQGSCPEFNIRLSNSTCSLEKTSYDTVTDSDTIFIGYADGSHMVYNISGNYAFSFDKDGNTVENRTLSDNVTIPQTSLSASISESIGVITKFAGLVLYSSGSSPTLKLFDVLSPLDFNPLLIGGLSILSNSQYKKLDNTEFTQTNTSGNDNNPSTSNAISIDLENFSGGTVLELGNESQIPDSLTQDVPVKVSDNFNAIKNFSDTYAKSWSGQGELGKTVYLPSYDANYALTLKDETVKILHKNGDGSVDVVSSPVSQIKSAITNQTNGIASPTYNTVDVIAKTISPSVINNDGSISQDSIIKKISTTDPATGKSIITDPSTGKTTAVIVAPSATSPTVAPTSDPAGVKTGDIDLKGVTNRLDSLVNQLSKVNNSLEDLNKEDYTKNLNGLSNTVVETTINPDAIDNFIGTFTTSWDNMKQDLKRVSTDGNSLIGRLTSDRNSGLSLNLPRATVTNCPYTSIIDFTSIHSSLLFPVDIDLCIAFSPSYPVFYILFSIMFMIFIISFAFRSIIRLV